MLFYANPKRGGYILTNAKTKSYFLNFYPILYSAFNANNIFSLDSHIKLYSKFYENNTAYIDENIDTSLKDSIKNVILFGSGQYGKSLLTLLKCSEYNNKNILLCDNDSKKWETFIEDTKVISPKKLFEEYHDDSIVIIGSDLYNKEIYIQLLNGGYPKDKIYFYKTENINEEYGNFLRKEM